MNTSGTASNPKKQIVFVTPSSNPEQDNKTRTTRHFVSKWASINRDGQLGGRPLRRNVSAKSKGLVAKKGVATGFSCSEEQRKALDCKRENLKNDHRAPKGKSHDLKKKPDDCNPRGRDAERKLVEVAVPSEAYQSIASVFESSEAYYTASPFQPSLQIERLLQAYQNCNYIKEAPSRKCLQALGAVSQERKSRWMGIAASNEAAYCALVAYFATAPGMLVDSKLASMYLTEALKAANRELADPRLANGPGIVLAVILLMAGAEHRQDLATFKTHMRGACALTRYRQRRMKTDACKVSSTRSPQARPRLRNRGASLPGFDGLVEAGLVSTVAWERFLGYITELSQLIQIIRDDPMIGLAATNHLFVDGFPTEITLAPFEIALYAVIRMTWHLILWHTWGLPCDAIEQRINMIQYWLPRAGIERLVQKVPRLLLWLSLITGALAKDEKRAWYGDLLQLVSSHLCVNNFTEALDAVEYDFIWKYDWRGPCQLFWNETMIDVDHGIGERLLHTEVIMWQHSPVMQSHVSIRSDLSGAPDDVEAIQDKHGHEEISSCAAVILAARGKGEIGRVTTVLPEVEGGEPYLMPEYATSREAGKKSNSENSVTQAISKPNDAKARQSLRSSEAHNPLITNESMIQRANHALGQADHMAAMRLRIRASTSYASDGNHAKTSDIDAWRRCPLLRARGSRKCFEE